MPAKPWTRPLSRWPEPDAGRCFVCWRNVRLINVRPLGGELSPDGELLFFAGAKKSNQKKAPSSTNRSRYVGGEGIFGLGLLPRSENGGHPWPPPLRGFRALMATAET